MLKPSLSQWKEHRNLFPIIPSQSRFNRRRRYVMLAFNLIRRAVLQTLDLACDRQCVIDSLPIPIVQFYLVPGSTRDWRAFGATFCKVPSKKQTIFGYKLSGAWLPGFTLLILGMFFNLKYIEPVI